MSTEKKYEALLWDCDGCLIDSEHIACALSARLITEAGYSVSTQEYIDRFCGRGRADMYAEIKQESGIDLFEVISDSYKNALQKEAFKAELKPIAGIYDVLNELQLPMAVASGSGGERLNFTLELTKLLQRFDGHVYSSELVARGKPAPDIFLYAADKLGVTPEGCLVIEDSYNGVKAAKGAGMTVFGFTGGSHILDKKNHAEELLSLGADIVFSDMAALPTLIRCEPR